MKIEHIFYDYLIDLGLSESTAGYLNAAALLIGLLIVALILDLIIKRIIIGVFAQFAGKTRTNFDDLLIQNNVPRNVAHIVPLLLVLEFIPQVLVDFPYVENLIEKGLQVFGIILTL